MSWPWVSRRAYELLEEQLRTVRTDCKENHTSLGAYKAVSEEVLFLMEAVEDTAAEVRFLRKENQNWADHARRLERKDHGMTEAPRELRTPVKAQPMPPKLKKYIESFGDIRTIKINRAVAYKRHADGESWDTIENDVVVPEEPRERIMGPEDQPEEQDEGYEEGDAGAAAEEEQEPGGGEVAEV